MWIGSGERGEGIVTQVGANPLSQLFLSFQCSFCNIPAQSCAVIFVGIAKRAAVLHPRRENVSPKIKIPIFIYKVHGNIFSIIIINIIIIEN